MSAITDPTDILNPINVPHILASENFDLEDFNTRFDYVQNHINDLRYRCKNVYFCNSERHSYIKTIEPIGNTEKTPKDNEVFLVFNLTANSYHHRMHITNTDGILIGYASTWESYNKVFETGSWSPLGRGLYICMKKGNEVLMFPAFNDIQIIHTNNANTQTDNDELELAAEQWVQATHLNEWFNTKNDSIFQPVWCNSRRASNIPWVRNPTTATYRNYAFYGGNMTAPIPEGYYFGKMVNTSYHFYNGINPNPLKTSITVRKGDKSYTYNNSANVVIDLDNF